MCGDLLMTLGRFFCIAADYQDILSQFSRQYTENNRKIFHILFSCHLTTLLGHF